jgi:hypothetical protein
MSERVQDEIDRLDMGGDLRTLRQSPNVSDEDFIKFLRNMMTPVRLSTKWVGNERMIDRKHQQQVAETLEADAEATRTVTKLYDFSHSRWRKIKRIKNDAYNLWVKMSIDYPPEDGIRLIRRELISEFVRKIDALRSELKEAEAELNNQFDEIIAEGKLRRGVAFKREDYPPTLLNAFDITYGFPSVECASEIRTLNPDLWMQECARLRENMDEALYKAEAVCLERMSEMVEILLDKLQPNPDGTKKIFRDSAIENIAEFVETFRKTNIGTSEKVQELISRLESITGTTTAETLRRSKATAERISEHLEKLRDEIKQVQVVEDEARIRRIGLRKIRQVAELEQDTVTDKNAAQPKSTSVLQLQQPQVSPQQTIHSK